MCVAVDARGKRADEQQHARQQCGRSGGRPRAVSNDGAGDKDHDGSANDGCDCHDAPQRPARNTGGHDPECYAGADRDDKLRAFHDFDGRMRARHNAATQFDEHAAGNGLSALAARSVISRPAPELAHSSPRLNHEGDRRQSCVSGLSFFPARRCSFSQQEARSHNPVMAMAADLTVVEVDQMVELGEMDPEAVATPSIFVDRVVVVGANA